MNNQSSSLPLKSLLIHISFDTNLAKSNTKLLSYFFYQQILKLIAHMARKSFQKTRKAYKAMRSRRLAKKEQELLDKKGAGLLQNYNVMKNVSTHSIISAPDADHRHGKPS